MAATPEETLAEEARRRTKAGAAAIAAGVLTLVGSLLAIGANNGFPAERLIQALSAAFDDGSAAGPGPVARKVLFFDDNIVQVVASQIVPMLANALVGVALVCLYLSTRDRDPELGKAPLIAAISGSVLALVAAIVGSGSLALDVTSFAGAAQQSEPAAREVLDSTFTQGALTLAGLGIAISGLAIALCAYRAMRVGLLTRFMGVLGIIVGVLSAVPTLVGQLPFVKIYWLIALGVLFLGRWPRGMPPAWVTGDPQPWPTQQELREQRMALQTERGAGGLGKAERRPRRGRAEPPETPAPEPPRSKPHSVSKKKKRKRR